MKKKPQHRVICLKCGPSKFKTVSKATKTYICRKCGTTKTDA